MAMLPTFKGYVVDLRLREFRKAKYPDTLEFVSFDSKKGQKLIGQMKKEGIWNEERIHTAPDN